MLRRSMRSHEDDGLRGYWLVGARFIVLSATPVSVSAGTACTASPSLHLDGIEQVACDPKKVPVP